MKDYDNTIYDRWM